MCYFNNDSEAYIIIIFTKLENSEFLSRNCTFKENIRSLKLLKQTFIIQYNKLKLPKDFDNKLNIPLSIK